MLNKSLEIFDAFVRDGLDAVNPDTSLYEGSFNVVRRQLAEKRKRKKRFFFWWIVLLLFTIPFSVYFVDWSSLASLTGQKGNQVPPNIYKTKDSNNGISITNKPELLKEKKTTVENLREQPLDSINSDEIKKQTDIDLIFNPKSVNTNSLNGNVMLQQIADSISIRDSLNNRLKVNSLNKFMMTQKQIDSASKKKQDSVYIIW